MQLKSGVRASLAWCLGNATIILSAFLLSIASQSWISFYLEISSLEPFSLFHDLIASHYTKGKCQWGQGYLFCFESYHFDKKMFFYIFTSAYFSPFNLKSLLNQKLSSSKTKFCFWDWQRNVSIFLNAIRLQLPRPGKECKKKKWTGDKSYLLLTQKWEENIPEFYFLYSSPYFFDTHVLAFYYQNLLHK